MKNHYMVMCKRVCKINNLKNNSGALHFLGCLSRCEKKTNNIEMEELKRKKTCFC